ncbi:hypothetical protein ACN42_g4224 [Penicillium freii]|uniref:Uncharacterized protein n=1 Tax=Penicillium freii TaxID=48697 RepID=A0A117NPS5_PENFR|nr:hypothetical protein ACN42_g4224 [Penicillium freii]
MEYICSYTYHFSSAGGFPILAAAAFTRALRVRLSKFQSGLRLSELLSYITCQRQPSIKHSVHAQSIPKGALCPTILFILRSLFDGPRFSPYPDFLR